MFACLQGPQAAAVAISAAKIVHLPPGMLLGACLGWDDDDVHQGTRGIAEIYANEAIFVSC